MASPKKKKYMRARNLPGVRGVNPSQPAGVSPEVEIAVEPPPVIEKVEKKLPVDQPKPEKKRVVKPKPKRAVSKTKVNKKKS